MKFAALHISKPLLQCEVIRTQHAKPAACVALNGVKGQEKVVNPDLSTATLGWGLDLCVALLLTQRNLLHQVQVAGKELAPQRVVQVEGHAVTTHGVIRLFPAIPDRLVSGLVLKARR